MNSVAKKCLGVGVAIGACMFSSVAFATSATEQVVVSASSGFAYGALSTARASSSAHEVIACGAGTGGYIYCYACDASDNCVYCDGSALGATGMTIVSAINPLSTVDFGFNTATGACTYITVENNSLFIP
jgi:hypothetical protein